MARARITTLKGPMASQYIMFRELDSLQLQAKHPQTRLPVMVGGEQRYEVVPDGWTNEQLAERLALIHQTTAEVTGRRRKDK